MRDRVTPNVPTRPAEDNGQTDGKTSAKPATHTEDKPQPSEPPKPTDAGAFDIGRLRLSQDFLAQLNVKQVVFSIPVGRPSKEVFFRVHPGEEFSFATFTLELKDGTERGSYLVLPDLLALINAHPALAPLLRPTRIFVCITRQNAPFLWPAKLPGPDGRLDDWSATALEAADRARAEWIKLVSDQQQGRYSAFSAGPDPAPKWPTYSLQELIDLGYKHRKITTWDDPLLRRLRGEA
jgi:hypothetical protein